MVDGKLRDADRITRSVILARAPGPAVTASSCTGPTTRSKTTISRTSDAPDVSQTAKGAAARKTGALDASGRAGMNERGAFCRGATHLRMPFSREWPFTSPGDPGLLIATLTAAAIRIFRGFPCRLKRPIGVATDKLSSRLTRLQSKDTHGRGPWREDIAFIP